MNHNYNLLENKGKRTFALNCISRRAAFELWTHQRKIDENKDILIVADRPGPKAPQTDNFHHTPFYSKIHSGGWLNSYLVDEDISETRLFWTNSATWDGKPGDTEILFARPWSHIFALGGNARKFLEKQNVPYVGFDHPQYHKRFVGSDGYPFIEALREALTES